MDLDSGRRKRGVVLEGGGAKGAYAFGCLLALKHMNLRIDAISGSSVGALNAVLYATDQLSLGVDIWTNLNSSKVFVAKPKLLAWAFGPLLVLLHTVGAHFAGLRVSRAYSLMVFLLVAGLLTYVTFHASSLPCLFQPIALLLVLGLAAGVAFTDKGRTQTAVMFLALGVLALIAAVVLAFGRTPRSSIPFLLLASPVILTTLGLKVIEKNCAMLQASPLRKLIRRVLRNRLQIPVFVTTASAKTYHDPDDMSWYVVGEFGPPDCLPFPKTKFVPAYRLLGNLSYKDRVDVVLASAALPFGIVSHVKIGPDVAVDGGVADNVPVYPFVYQCPCEEIIVIRLNPVRSCKAWEASCIRELQVTRRLHRLLKRPNLQSKGRESRLAIDVHNDPPAVVPFKKLRQWPETIVIAPRRNLGGFLTGTMNFSATYAKALMVDGFLDTLQQMRKHYGLQIPATPSLWHGC